MTKKSRKTLFKIQPQSGEATSQIFIIFRLSPFHLNQERKLVYALWQNHMRYSISFVGNVRFYLVILFPNYRAVLKV